MSITKIEKLTPEQEALIPQIRDKWLNLLFGPDGPKKLDKEACREGVEWMYELAGLEKPLVIFVESPLGCQLAANMIKKLDSEDFAMHPVQDFILPIWNSFWESVENSIEDSGLVSIRDSVWTSIQNFVWVPVSEFARYCVEISIQNSICDPVESSITGSVDESVLDLVRDSTWDFIHTFSFRVIWTSVWNSIKDSEVEYFRTTNLDYDWHNGFGAFCDYWDKLGVLQNDNFKKYKKYLLSGPFYTIFLEGVAFVCGLPNFINIDSDGRLHCETGPAIGWDDGYSQCCWHGVSVPSRWIDEPLNITSKDFLGEDNAERRRCLHEILGTERLTEILELEVVDVKEVPFWTWDQGAFLGACRSGELGEDMCGFTEDKIFTEPEKILPYYDLFIKREAQIITLKRTKNKIDGERRVQFIEIRCPSTGEIFHLGVPSSFTDAAEARAWTLYMDTLEENFET